MVAAEVLIVTDTVTTIILVTMPGILAEPAMPRDVACRVASAVVPT